MIGSPRFRSSRRLASIALGLGLSLLLQRPALAQQKVVDTDGFLVEGKPATRNQGVEGKQLTGKRGAEILLSCWEPLEKRELLLLYVCKGGECSVTACSVKAGETVGNVEVRKWSFTPSARERESLFTRWLSYLPRLEPKPAAVAAARGLGDPVDAVVLQDDAGVHWAPALAGVLEGSYCLTVGTLPASARTWTTTLQWDRRRDPEGIAKIGGLAPGLYSLRKGTASGAACQPDSDDGGWVLVASSGQFPRLDAEWRSYAASVEEFERTGVSPTLIATLRRAGLAGLAEP